MLKSILYRYSRSIITGRPIEQARKINIMVKALARDAEPDRDAIAHFISSRAQAVKELFSQVLFECHAPGLIGGELLALEALGKKPANWKRLMERIVEQHIQPDREGKGTSGINATAAAYVYDEGYRKGACGAAGKEVGDSAKIS
jgi:hypothetical protein